jgi:hypothetical protein
MNKMLKSLLVAALTLSAAHLQADTSGSTNRTYLSPRAAGLNMPMAWSTFGELVNHKGDDRFGASVAVTGFWQQSVDGGEQGKYFLANNKSTINVTRVAVGNPVAATSDLDAGYIYHNAAGVADGAAINMALNPRQEVMGVRLDYHQDLRKILKGLYFHAGMPVARVENNVRLNINDATLTGYLAGTANNTANSVTEALKYGKVAGKQSETGVADIDLSLGYNFLHSKKYSAGLAVALTVPTGNESNGVYLFQPIVGNGKYFGLGGDLHAHANLWSNGDRNLGVCAALKYRYLFENSSVRTLGLKGRNLGQYHTLGKDTVASLVPAANVTTMAVNVTPGSQLEGALGLAYNHGNFSFGLGYDLYFREAESVSRKGSLAANTYGVAARNFSTAAAFNITTAAHFDGGVAAVLSNDNLDVAAAATPSQFSNAINGSAGYVFRKWDCPLMLGVGAKYEFANKNSVFSQWGAWLKAGVGF